MQRVLTLCRKSWRVVAAGALLLPLTFAATPTSAAERAVPTEGPQFLTATRSAAPPLDIAANYLRAAGSQQGLTPADLEGVRVERSFESRNTGTTHVYYRQRFGDLEVVNAVANINIAADGRVINMGESLVSGLATKVNTVKPSLDARSALLSAYETLGIAERSNRPVQASRVDQLTAPGAVAFFDAGVSNGEIPMHLALFHTADGAVRLVWDARIELTDGTHYWNVWVDAVTGDVLGQNDWVNYDSYDVFAFPKESPLDGPRTIAANPADTSASPFGWHDTNGAAGADFTDTRGNNVSAQEDRDANNAGGFRPSGGSSLVFSDPLDLSTQSPVDYQAAAITNLFYWNNIIHDVLWHYGFDEPSGNFQENNYGRGGSGSDSVNADAQDGSGTDNANFSTPPDGSNPRMQMYEWTPSADSLVRVTGPASISGDYQASAATFGSALPGGGISGTFELVNDGSAAPTQGCNSLVGFTPGNIAVIDRGSCEFGTKVLNAQNAGAAAAIVVNNSGDALTAMGPGAEGNRVNISSVFVGQTDGTTIKGELPGVTGTLLSAGSSIPNRDSDLDAGIIAHEYGHGLSIRLTGGAGNSNCLSGSQQAGEGWSDWLALALTATPDDAGDTPRGVGNYSTFQPDNGPGIRRFPYTTDMTVNPDVYSTINTGISVPHGVGSVWTAILWEVYWELTNAHGFDPNLYNGNGGNTLAIQLMVDGLKLQPCNPTFVDARDAVLLADQNLTGGANQCLLWAGFAKRGLGVNASDGGSSNSLSVTDSFDVPQACLQTCGNGIVEGSEICDGPDLGGGTCGDFGCTGGGSLACNNTCDGYDTSACQSCPACNFNGICEFGEDCLSCESDCASGSTSGAVCGNGICEAGDGENCTNCALDCAGTTGGKPANRFCCGDGGGTNPVGCNDARCTANGLSCSNAPTPSGSFCCGDNVCDPGENCSVCALDCTGGAELCSDGIDNDCNGDIDCSDISCMADPSCQSTGGGPGAPCTVGSDCNSGQCKRNGTCR